MRLLLFAGALWVCAAAFPVTAQDRPNLTGVWTLPGDAPVGPNGQPAAAPGFGPQITIWHEGNSLTVTRVFAGGSVAVTHVLDGSETRSTTPGRLCEGDSQSLWTAAWQDNAVATTLVGSIPPGATARFAPQEHRSRGPSQPSTRGADSFEFLCIVERNGGLVYTAMPNGRQPATDFTLTIMEPTSVTFENPSHDFPKMIRYTLGHDGTLEAVVSGTDRQKPQIFRFKKQ